MNDLRQGIVHVIGPEQGATLPGMTVVCGDSHTSTHGAFGALAFGIGTSEVEHVLATQTLLMKKSKNMLVKVDGRLQPGSTAKDIVLAVIGKIGTAGGTGNGLHPHHREFSSVSAAHVADQQRGLLPDSHQQCAGSADHLRAAARGSHWAQPEDGNQHAARRQFHTAGACSARPDRLECRGKRAHELRSDW